MHQYYSHLMKKIQSLIMFYKGKKKKRKQTKYAKKESNVGMFFDKNKFVLR